MHLNKLYFPPRFEACGTWMWVNLICLRRKKKITPKKIAGDRYKRKGRCMGNYSQAPVEVAECT